MPAPSSASPTDRDGDTKKPRSFWERGFFCARRRRASLGRGGVFDAVQLDEQVLGEFAREAGEGVGHAGLEVVAGEGGFGGGDGFAVDERFAGAGIEGVELGAEGGAVLIGDDGVGNCKVIPLWQGNGTVKVIIVTAENESASAELIQEVYDYIESQRPIGATVTVVSPAPLSIDLTADVYGTASPDAVKAAMTAYLKQTGFTLSYVSLAQMGKLLLSISGITDYKDLKLNGKAANVELTNEQIPVAGKVVLNLVSQ